MKIKSVSIKNFRAFKDEIYVEFDDLTAFVGRNDIGKTSVLEALDIFFNEGDAIVKLDKNDANKECPDGDVIITVEFSNMPVEIVLDEDNRTTLASEYLLTADNTIKIQKTYSNGKPKKINIIANHPTNPLCCDLLSMKISDLKKVLDREGLDCDKTRSAEIRKTIWNKYHDELACQEVLIDVAKEGAKDIYQKLSQFLPLFSLFHSDRSNNDTDSEVQDPMKLAVRQIIQSSEVKTLCDQIAAKVREKLSVVAGETLSKLSEMSPDIASTLTPSIPLNESLKWADVFKSVSINSDEEIPLNKRGSGVKRLVLISFFRAEAERKKTKDPLGQDRGIIYAIEEPETAQHRLMQKQLIDALKTLSENAETQIILTSHSSYVVKQLSESNLRLVSEIDGVRKISRPSPQVLPYVSLNEINYTSFGDYSEEYHNELYGYIQEYAMNQDSNCCKEKEFENWLCSCGIAQTKQWIRINSNGPQSPVPVTLQTYIRNTIHHPENTLNTRYSFEEIKTSVSEMRKFIKNGCHA